MIKNVTWSEWLEYAPASRLTFPIAFVSTLVEHLEAVSAAPDNLNEQALSGELGYSQPHFRRLCLLAIGETAHSFVLRRRLERVANRLSTTDIAISQLSKQAAFQSREAFTRSFHSHFGCSPTEFRRLNCEAQRVFPEADEDDLGLAPRSVSVRTGDLNVTTFLFDGPILLGRYFSDGRIDWRSTFRRDAKASGGKRSS